MPPTTPRSRRKPGRWRRWLLLGLGAAGLLGVGAIWTIAPFWELASRLGQRTSTAPSRLFARPLALGVERPLELARLRTELEALAYRQVEGDAALPSGTWREQAGMIEVSQRGWATTSGYRPPQGLVIRHQKGQITGLEIDGRPTPGASLEPVQLAAWYGPHQRERRFVPLERMPEHLVLAVLAAEDAGFFEHAGVSPTGILRALLANARGREMRQGGSTLTQQLVKNVFLTHERTVGRKVREALLAVILDLRYDKRDILEAYLNEIYLGQSGSVSLIGVGAASWVYFGKEVAALDLGEAATLAGIIPSPGPWAPTRALETATARRNLVLDRLAELAWLDEATITAARTQPLVAAEQPLAARRAPWFAALAEREARERYGVEALADTGFTVLSTLDWGDQLAAQTAVREGLAELERRLQKPKADEGPLQSALVSLDPATGGILAWVGGRDFNRSQFDRAGLARRQIGSAFKPIVVAAAFEAGLAQPATILDDAPFTHGSGRTSWSPRNSDGTFRGPVTVRETLEHSLNVPTARLALDAGIPAVAALARQMGIRSPLEEVPALALGTAEITPLELASVYATLAAGGRRPAIHGIAAILGADGTPLPGSVAGGAKQVMAAETAFLVTSCLQGVLDRGTGASARRLGVEGRLAGKTGTTNDRRDAWFAGYSPTRATAVWVGYDDNRTMRATGTTGALPIWSRFVKAVKPAGGWPLFPQPPKISSPMIDPTTGELASSRCPERRPELFRSDLAPRRICSRHSGRFG